MTNELALNLGYLVPEFPSQTHTFFWREVEALRRLGVAVHMLSTRRPRAGACRHAFAKAAAAETHYLFPPEWSRALVLLLRHPMLTLGAARYVFDLNETPLCKRLLQLALLLPAAQLRLEIRRLGIDHLHVHSCAHAAHVAALSRLLGGCTYSLTLHGDLSVYGSDHRGKASHAAFVACVTRPLQMQVCKATGLAPEQVPVLWMGVDTSRFVDAGLRRPVAGELRLLTVARLNPTKGHRFALRALKIALDAGLDARYVIAGEGPEREAIELEVNRLGLQRQVQLVGSKSEDEVLDLLQRADAMLLTSVGAGEAAPVSVMEAMSCSVPVVCSIIGGTADMITDGVDGFLVEQEDIRAIADRLITLGRDLAMRQRVGRAARTRAANAFDCNPLAERLVHLIGLHPAPQSSEVACRMKVLLVAEAANPEWTSVPLIGWSLAKAMRQITDAHVVTQIRNRQAFLNAGMREGLDFTAIDTERLERPLWRLARVMRGGPGLGWTIQTAISSISYPYFERLVWKEFGADIRAHKYDVVHRITPLTPTAPSSLARRCSDAGVPFVLGPLNGGVPWPSGFDSARRQEREWLSYVRGAYRLVPRARSTLKHAAAVIAGSKFTLGDLPQQYKDKYFYLPENAIDPERFSRIAQPFRGGVLRAAFVGRLVPYKGPDMLLEAAAPLLRDGRMVLDVLGDGPLMTTLKEFVRLHDLAGAVTFHGWVPHDKVQDVLSQSHVLALPSIREFGGGVVLEAMAMGIVPIVVDYAGPSELVNANTGVKVPLGVRDSVVSGFRDALANAIADPAAINALSTQGRSHVHAHFTWKAKAARVLAVYRSVTSPAFRRSTMQSEPTRNRHRRSRRKARPT